jgi:hypothetical protein
MVLTIARQADTDTVTSDRTAITGYCVYALSMDTATYTALSDRKHLDRLLEWAGPAKDFHGLLLFDESHKVW